MANHKTNNNGVPQWAIKWFKRYDMWFEKLNQITLEIERRNQKQDELIDQNKKMIEEGKKRIEQNELEIAELKKMNETYGKAIIKLLSKQK